MTFAFTQLPIDLQRYIVMKMPAIDRYFLMVCSKSLRLFTEAPGIHSETRLTLIQQAVAEDRVQRICYLLPDNHWITHGAAKIPGHFWKILGYGVGVGDYYRSADTKMKVMRHLMESASFTVRDIIEVIRIGVSVLFIEDFYLVPLLETLIVLLGNRTINIKRLLLSLIRAGRVELTAKLLGYFSRVSPVVLNSAMRMACVVNMVPDFSAVLLSYY
jgi:hypothetical protein